MARGVQRPAAERGLKILLLPFTQVRRLDGWRRLALAGVIVVAIGSLMGFPDFGWVEAAQLLVAVSSLRMIARAVETHPFASPFADGTLLALGGIWTALIALVNAFFYGAQSGTELVVTTGCVLLFAAGMMIRAGEGRHWYEDTSAPSDELGA